jgi:hypothetical protein
MLSCDDEITPGAIDPPPPVDADELVGPPPGPATDDVASAELALAPPAPVVTPALAPEAAPALKSGSALPPQPATTMPATSAIRRSSSIGVR